MTNQTSYESRVIMKRIVTFISITLSVIILSACFASRTDLFTLPIEEDTYTLDENLEAFVDIEGKEITYVGLTFRDLHQTADEDSKYQVNTFGDFSFEEIKVFEIEFYLGIDDNEPQRYDLSFLGYANPGRSNAYAFRTVIDGFNQEESDYRLVIELRTHIGGYDDRIGHFMLQFNNVSNSEIGKTVYLRNNLEKCRDKKIKYLDEAFSTFKRENYTQESWNMIFTIQRSTRAAIDKALDIETINQLYDQALIDFSNVPIFE